MLEPLSNGNVADLIEKLERSAYALGQISGSLSTLLSMLTLTEMTQEDMRKEVKEMWVLTGLHVNEIFYHKRQKNGAEK